MFLPNESANTKISFAFYLELDWIDLTLDKKTANKLLWISDDCSKVVRRTKEVCPVLDGPERYEYSPQVSQKKRQN